MSDSYRRRRGGFTLIEIIIALAIAVLLVGVTIPTVSTLLTVRRKTASQELVGTIRYLFDKSQLDHKYIRMVFDMDANEYWAEQADSPVALMNKAQEVKDGAIVEDEDAKEEEKLTQEEEDEELFGSSMNSLFEDKFEWHGWYDFKQRMRRKQVQYTQYVDDAVKRTKLPPGVKLHGVVTPELESMVTKGQAPLVFFPSGFVQPCIVYIAEGGDEPEEGQVSTEEPIIWSIRIDPLSGRGAVVEGLMEPPNFKEEAKDNETVF